MYQQPTQDMRLDWRSNANGARRRPTSPQPWTATPPTATTPTTPAPTTPPPPPPLYHTYTDPFVLPKLPAGIDDFAGRSPVPYTTVGDTPAFLPDTPAFQRGLRSLNDQYDSAMASILAQRAGLAPAYQQAYGRMSSDVGSQRSSLNNAMVGRGLYDSSVRRVVDQSQIQQPYGRQLQDMNQQMGNALGQLALGEQSAVLGWNQGLADLLLQRAADVLQANPYGASQMGPQDRDYGDYDYWFVNGQTTPPYGSDSPYNSTPAPRRRRRR